MELVSCSRYDSWLTIGRRNGHARPGAFSTGTTSLFFNQSFFVIKEHLFNNSVNTTRFWWSNAVPVNDFSLNSLFQCPWKPWKGGCFTGRGVGHARGADTHSPSHVGCPEGPGKRRGSWKGNGTSRGVCEKVEVPLEVFETREEKEWLMPVPIPISSGQEQGNGVSDSKRKSTF